MPIITDSGFIYALYNAQDSRHEEAMNFAIQYGHGTVVPQVVLPEVSYLFLRDVGYSGVQRFVGQFKHTNTPLEPVTRADIQRVDEIMVTYADAELDFVDCCIMAMSERLNIEEVATFDRRDFGMFRPRHCDHLMLLP